MESQAETELAAQIDGSGSVQIVIRRVVLVPLVVSA
jgi:ABC-type maltose transport system permease subunit